MVVEQGQKLELSSEEKTLQKVGISQQHLLRIS